VAALNAWNGTNTDPISFAANALLDNGASQGEAGNVGYNSGYIRAVFDHPPNGLTSSAAWDISYNSATLFDVDITTSQLQYPLSTFKKWQDKINSNHLTSQLQALKNTWLTQQNSGYNTGFLTWTNFLAISNVISQTEFTTLLQSSTAFLEIVEYDALGLSEGVGENSVPLSQQAALVHACLTAFSGGYSTGLLNSQYDTSSPRPFPHITV